MVKNLGGSVISNESFQNRMWCIRRPLLKIELHDSAGTGIPAQDCVVVSSRGEGLGFFIIVHGLQVPLIGIEIRTVNS